MKPSQQKLNVTAIVHGDTGVITAFVTKLPGLLVQGNSHDDVAAKIDKVVQVFIKADRKSTRLNSSHSDRSRMPSSA